MSEDASVRLACPAQNARFPRAAVITLATIVTAAAVGVAGEAHARPVTLDDLYRVTTVSDPQFSPDGEWIAYCLTKPDRKADRDETDIWLARWDGSETVQLTRSPGSECTPRWSPDGRRLAFLSDRGDAKAGEQIWVLDVRGGEARQLGKVDGGVFGFAWSPDGRRIALTAYSPKPPEDADPDKPAPIVIDRLQFKRDGEGWLRNERTHIFLMDTASGATEQLTRGNFDHAQPAWSPDGETVAFLSKRGDDPDAHANWDLYLAVARAGAEPRQITTNRGTDGDAAEDWSAVPPQFDATGQRIAYIAAGKPEDIWYSLLQVAVTKVASGATTLPTAALDRNTLDPHWSTDSRALYFRLEDDRAMQLARVHLTVGRVERLTAADAVVSAFDVGAKDRVALVIESTDRPTELAVLERGALRRVSRHNESWLREVTLARATNIEFSSPDGLAIHGMLMTPPGPLPAGGFPALLRLHGGPVSQYQHEFDFAWQWFIANGYAVIAPNPRGSTGRGYAFQRMLFARWGIVDVPDVLAAVDHVVGKGIADPSRLGVGGWSYGAILTNYVIASDARFKAATSGAGMSNMFAGYGADHYQREWELELGLPWKNPALWQEMSYPYFHADRIRTPTLFLVGEDDENVPLIGSAQMYQALRRLGVPTQLIVYPGETHGLSRPSLRADRLERYVKWYDRFVRGVAP
jgi:dipeptidyl aminopeptidase/acylaminoacyl peptidase